jgi:hypothetical protein
VSPLKGPKTSVRHLLTGERSGVLLLKSPTDLPIAEHVSMPSRPARVLCVLRTGQFDLVVVSAWLSEWERGKILSSTGKTPIHVLSGFTVASQLLEAVERRLPRLAED